MDGMEVYIDGQTNRWMDGMKVDTDGQTKMDGWNGSLYRWTNEQMDEMEWKFIPMNKRTDG